MVPRIDPKQDDRQLAVEPPMCIQRLQGRAMLPELTISASYYRTSYRFTRFLLLFYIVLYRNYNVNPSGGHLLSLIGRWRVLLGTSGLNRITSQRFRSILWRGSLLRIQKPILVLPAEISATDWGGPASASRIYLKLSDVSNCPTNDCRASVSSGNSVNGRWPQRAWSTGRPSLLRC